MGRKRKDSAVFLCSKHGEYVYLQPEHQELDGGTLVACFHLRYELSPYTGTITVSRYLGYQVSTDSQKEKKKKKKPHMRIQQRVPGKWKEEREVWVGNMLIFLKLYMKKSHI